MIKIFLVLSLILNVVLSILYYQLKNEPPLERIIMENKHEQVKYEKKHSHENVVMKNRIIFDNMKELPPTERQTEADPILVQDEQSFMLASDELNRAQNNYLEELQISEKMIQKKNKLTAEFYQKTGLLHQKRSPGLRMSFKDRRLEIELEEKLHQDFAKLLGEKKWERYRDWVDNYNVKLLKNHKSNEFSPLMMSY